MKKRILFFTCALCGIFIVLTAFFVALSAYGGITDGALSRMVTVAALMIAASVFVGVAWGSRVLKSIIGAINNLKLDEPEDNKIFDELSPFLSRVKRQRDIIDQQLSEISQKKAEFSAITDNMREGLVVLGTDRQVLIVNRSALAMLHTEGDPRGQNVLSLNRGEAFSKTVAKAFEGSYAETVLKIKGRHLQLIASPIADTGDTRGVVLMLLDVTEREDHERLRREFTANVSHELKTPLTAISGYAEIIAAGMAGEEDIPRFADKIYHETQRLINLIGDIMTLSRLDEKDVSPAWENVEMYRLAGEIAARLEDASRKSGVAITLTGENVVVNGMRPVLDEILYNLMDNAVKYNVKGGTVQVNVARENGMAVVSVADTGIGISEAERERVFERFYRVEKGRGGDVEGTGLGLSIVKHGALLHNGAVDIRGNDTLGTIVTLKLPAVF